MHFSRIPVDGICV